MLALLERVQTMTTRCDRTRMSWIGCKAYHKTELADDLANFAAFKRDEECRHAGLTPPGFSLRLSISSSDKARTARIGASSEAFIFLLIACSAS
jgi:hypothetical protein